LTAAYIVIQVIIVNSVQFLFVFCASVNMFLFPWTYQTWSHYVSFHHSRLIYVYIYVFQYIYVCMLILWSSTKFRYSLNVFMHMLKVNGLDIYIPPLTGKPKQQRFTNRSGILTSISSRRCSAIIGRPLPEWTDFLPTSCTAAFTVQHSPATTHYF